MTAYAWQIDTDHLAERDPSTFTSEVGTTGPRSAPAAYLAILAGTAKATGTVKVHTFVMHDDDGEKYYTGRMVTDTADGVSEEAAYGPLGDFGHGSGCTSVRYPRHQHLDCG